MNWIVTDFKKFDWIILNLSYTELAYFVMFAEMILVNWHYEHKVYWNDVVRWYTLLFFNWQNWRGSSRVDFYFYGLVPMNAEETVSGYVHLFHIVHDKSTLNSLFICLLENIDY